MNGLTSAGPPPIRRLVRTLRRWERLATWRLRAEPSFLIVGAQKSGTTSMYNHLVSHPQVRRPLTKEVHYFDVHYSRGPAWYRSNFPLKAARQGAWITGEATPAYLFHPGAPERVAALLPGARLVVLLRNPVDRAYSHYHHELAKGAETLSFEQALKAEPTRLEGELERQMAEADYFSYNARHYAYLERGMYADQLSRWLAFFPWDQLLVLRSECLFANPGPVLRRVHHFLALDHLEADDFDVHNDRDYEAMDPGVRGRLVEHYREPNERLFQMLGRSFDWG